MNIGERIKHFRQVASITQQELADKIHVSNKTIGNYENGKRLPSIDVLQKIAEALSITTSTLLNEEKESEKEEINVQTPYEPEVYYQITLKDVENTLSEYNIDPNDICGITFGVDRILGDYQWGGKSGSARLIFNYELTLMDILTKYETADDYSHYIDFEAPFEENFSRDEVWTHNQAPFYKALRSLSNELLEYIVDKNWALHWGNPIPIEMIKRYLNGDTLDEHSVSFGNNHDT